MNCLSTFFICNNININKKFFLDIFVITANFSILETFITCNLFGMIAIGSILAVSALAYICAKEFILLIIYIDSIHTSFSRSHT